MNKVSIVIPVYNVEKYIEDCLMSVAEQSYPLIEIVLIDDCGTDNSMKIVENTLKKISREGLEVTVVHHKKNEGVSVARNHGIDSAKGDFILFLDSDDMLEPLCLKKMVSRIEETDADVVMCNHRTDVENRTLGGYLSAPVDELISKGDCFHGLAKCWFNVMPWGKLLKTSFIRKHHLYFEENIMNEDVLWTFQLCMEINKIAFVHEALFYYRYNSQSIMSSAKIIKKANSAEIISRKYSEILDKKVELQGNRDVYIVLMRQIVLYYTIIAQNFGFKQYMQKISLFSKYLYKKSFFPGFRVPLPITYKLWSLLNYMPVMLQGILSYALIVIQNKKHS